MVDTFDVREAKGSQLMRLLQVAQQFPGIVHNERSLQVSAAGVDSLVRFLSGVLVVAVLIEMLLFRTFARTGIYLFHDDTPQWVYWAYTSAVWLGNTMFNFAAILITLLFALMAAYVWLRRDIFGRTLPFLAALMVPWNIALFFASPGPTAALLYLCLSAGIIAVSAWVSWPGSSRGARTFLLVMAASVIGVYYFEATASLRQLGFGFNDRGVAMFQISEALAGIAILAAFITWGRTRNLKLLAAPVVVGILISGAYFSAPERLPLISTWALGVTMSMPFLLYAVGATLLGVTMLKLLTYGNLLAAYGLTLLYFSHRMLPLTYFNLLILGGFIMMTIAITRFGTERKSSSVDVDTAVQAPFAI